MTPKDQYVDIKAKSILNYMKGGTQIYDAVKSAMEEHFNQIEKGDWIYVKEMCSRAVLNFNVDL